MQAKSIIDCHNELGEGPIWHPLENRLYWLDILKGKIQRYDPISMEYQTFLVGQKISAIGLRGTNTFITAGENGFAFWDVDRNTFRPICHPEKDKSNARFNDGKVDRNGRFWAGTMTTTDASSTLYRLDENLEVTPMIRNVTISNGIGWSPDDTVMYFADTRRYIIYAYDFNQDSGELSAKREFVRFSGRDGSPDGLTVDAQGCVWCALWGGWRVDCYSPEGKCIERVDVPVEQPSSCAFGGIDFDTLFITSAREGLSEAKLADQPQAGNLFACQPGVRGLPEPKFAG
jgi:sugar lactone lactonase YvrE